MCTGGTCIGACGHLCAGTITCAGDESHWNLELPKRKYFTVTVSTCALVPMQSSGVGILWVTFWLCFVSSWMQITHEFTLWWPDNGFNQPFFFSFICDWWVWHFTKPAYICAHHTGVPEPFISHCLFYCSLFWSTIKCSPQSLWYSYTLLRKNNTSSCQEKKSDQMYVYFWDDSASAYKLL